MIMHIFYLFWYMLYITKVNVLYHKGTNNQTDSGSTEFTKMVEHY